MKIIFLLKIWPIFGGGETVTLALANEFVKRGINVSVLYFKHRVSDNMPYIDERIQSVQIPDLDFNSRTNHSVSDKDINKTNSYIEEYVINHSIDIIINQALPSETTIAARQHAKIVKCRHMCLFQKVNTKDITWHGKDGIKKILGEKCSNWINRRINIKNAEYDMRLCDKYVFLSKGFLNDYLQLRPNSPYKDKLDYCNNPSTYNTKYQISDLKNKENIVLFVGRMEETHKQVSKILRIWSKIEHDGRFDNWSLNLVGSGSDEDLYHRLAIKLNLKTAFFLGHKNPLEYYKKAKIFLMTSRLEGWGMTLVEAQSNGVVPIVLDTFSSCHDIIENKENGIIVEMHDIDGYVNNLKQLMIDDRACELMAKNGLETCKQFSVNKIADKWMSIFQELL